MLKRLYLRFRQPKVFLIALMVFIVTSTILHFVRGYDSDWGTTNLTLSVEASIASAVLTVAAEESIYLLREILKIVTLVHSIVTLLKEQGLTVEKILKGVLLIAEAQREVLMDHATILRTMQENDRMILELLKEKK